ncbi:glucose-6-phosphate exchanger SLC37A4-like [Montipora capricornis]|uniref:glucose-6-phosphate exchanger SLC37A4-like n=1 Tax=Montipora capricornis TaxID=246305 RepID=UPI0035F123E3
MAQDRCRRYQRIRWTIYGSLFLGYSSYYFCRKSYTFAIPALMYELSLNKNELGVISSGFSAMYGASKFTSGLLSDTLSPRTMFTAGMFLTGIFNIVIGFTGNLWLLTLLWSINGLCQGCGWPPCVKLLREWFSPYELGTLWSLLTAGCNLATSVSPILTVYLTTNYGWSAAFVVPGVTTVLLCILAYFAIVDSPSEAGLDEFHQITPLKSRTEHDPVNKKSTQIVPLLLSPFLWVLSIGYLMTLFVKAGVSDWTQLFLIESVGRSQYESGIVMSFLEIGGLFGSIASGYVTDILVRKYGASTTSSPRIPPMIAFAVIQLLCLYLLHTAVSSATTLWIISALIFGIGFSLYTAINLYGVLALENSPPELSGTAHAIVALIANVGATLGGFPLTAIGKAYGWSGMFIAMELATLFCCVLLIITKTMNREMVDSSKLE